MKNSEFIKRIEDLLGEYNEQNECTITSIDIDLENIHVAFGRAISQVCNVRLKFE